MKWLISLTLFVFCLAIAPSPVSIAADKASVECPANSPSIKVAIAYDIGGRGDNSFNDSAAKGIDWLKECGITIREVSVTTGADSERKNELRLLAEAGYNPIIAVGYLYGSPIKVIATENPKVQFGVIDDSTNQLLNVASLVFTEEEGSYLAGVAAALATKTGKIGFIGGVRIPLIQKYEAGFIAGVKSLKESATIESKYISEFPDFSGFNNPAKAKTITEELINNGVDVVYVPEIESTPRSILGVVSKAKELSKSPTKFWIIGSGIDLAKYLGKADASTSEYILTSMLKNIDVAVIDLVLKYAKNGLLTEQIEPGIYGHRYGLADGGVSLSGTGNNLDSHFSQIFAAKDKLLAEKAAAELKVKQEAEAKAAAELKVKQDAEAKAAAELKAKQEAEAKAISDKAAAESKAKKEAEARAAELAAAKKVKTITCTKAKLTKKVTSIKPVCPRGYKKK